MTNFPNLVVATCNFRIGRLEKWWLAFDKMEFAPEGRKHLFGFWFWREN
jgi:hypothetical protein